ncbi:hypothetical protein BV25DRAFT_1806725 [Artomyces pyxidatus]|uniref:Uncharacterized protein n=1 Tax=Artomyces pyxidatus TaxID=48021 RepID=A0ACB8SY05_9AGAM|nr:hypothetical protein BV25DRAFT_1806725 [Artomyces pyxidatus]
MTTEPEHSSQSRIREVINGLQTVSDLPTLLSLISAPLDCLGLLPPPYKHYNTVLLAKEAFNTRRHLPLLQRAVLEHVLPTWEPTLSERGLLVLVEQYFVPDAFSYAIPSAGEVAIYAYSTVLSLALTTYSIGILARLSKSYPIDRIHTSVFSGTSKGSLPGQTTLAWEDAVKSVVSVPAKVANALAGKGDLPEGLEQGAYFQNLCLRTEILVASLASNRGKESTDSLTFLLTKLVNVGAFPASPPSAPAQPSFFHSTLPTIRSRLANQTTVDASSYSAIWSDILNSFPSSFTLQSIVTSLFGHLAVPDPVLETSSKARGLVKREAELVRHILGSAIGLNPDQWEIANAIMLGREWSEGHSRIFVCWAAGAQKGRDSKALDILLLKVRDRWTSSEHIKHSLLSKHHYVTLFLLNIISNLPSNSTAIQDLALSPPFIRSIGTYIGHLDVSVRRCGMLVAEEIAHRTGRKLDFKDWDGDEGGKGWARAVRALIAESDADADVAEEEEHSVLETKIEDTLHEDALENTSKSERVFNARADLLEGCDSDDSLTGYASPSSSRSASPTRSELDELEKDPTLNVGRKKIARPVYLAQLGEMVRSTSGLKSDQENQEADKAEVALGIAEELIRRKRGYGTELEENAVNLVYGFVGLQDNFDLEQFDLRRQAALNALVACCPRKAAPAIAEEFFKNQYSTDQRYVMLNALALGARELAGLPLPPAAAVQPLTGKRVTFPSKRLPSALHERYLVASATTQVQGLLQGITRLTIDNTRDANAERTPGLIRERQLRVRQPARVAEVKLPSNAELVEQIRMAQSASASTTFTDVAVEHFIYPLVNRFWTFLRDEQTREERSAHRDQLHRYRGAGTGLILNAVVLSHFLATLGVLVHAARNAPAWLAVVAPDTLELAVTLGTRPVSLSPEEEHDSGGEGLGSKDKEAQVLTMALELALVVLDGCLELDGGRSLGLEHTALLLAVGEWAQEVFGRLEKGVLVKGGGGAAEVRLSKAAAGVVIKVDELSGRWRRAMIDVTS